MERVIQRVQFPLSAPPKMEKVAAYARVSSGKDAMLHSLSAQVSYYNQMIQSHPGWLYAGVYSDEAFTGTKESRNGFQTLLADCRAKKIDRVITKSISRFARNTVTLLNTVRELKNIGIDVFFEEENIHSMSAAGELMLTILASYAQEESRSVSENQKWRVKKNFEEGKPWNGTILGYRYKDGVFEIVPDEAAIVRRIFQLYLDGLGVQRIIAILNEENIKTRYGREYNRGGMQKILRNYTYTGNLLLQKTFQENHLTKKTIFNIGQRPMYHVEDSHEPIIDMETFVQVQEEIKRRAKIHHAEKQEIIRYDFTSLIECGICGKKFNRKCSHAGPVWICRTLKHEGKKSCASKQIPESILIDLTEDDDMSTIEKIVAFNGNKLVFHFRDGTVEERSWTDRSRSNSWTEEMREQARKDARKRWAAI